MLLQAHLDAGGNQEEFDRFLAFLSEEEINTFGAVAR